MLTIKREHIQASFTKYLTDYCENLRVRPGEKAFAGGYAVKASQNIASDYVVEEAKTALVAAHAYWGSQAPEVDPVLKVGHNYVMALLAGEAFDPHVIAVLTPPDVEGIPSADSAD